VLLIVLDDIRGKLLQLTLIVGTFVVDALVNGEESTMFDW
jgi:hypothetical protein